MNKLTEEGYVNVPYLKSIIGVKDSNWIGMYDDLVYENYDQAFEIFKDDNISLDHLRHMAFSLFNYAKKQDLPKHDLLQLLTFVMDTI